MQAHLCNLGKIILVVEPPSSKLRKNEPFRQSICESTAKTFPEARKSEPARRLII